jgi:hypothetical protein
MGKKYVFVRSCVDYDDGMEVQEITRFDCFEYGVESFCHDPKLEISKEEFYEKTGIENERYSFYGHNKDLDIVFAYDEDSDVHDFFE